MAWIVSWQVFVDGEDRSEGMRPYLMEIEVSDKEGQTGDTCRLVFDDSNGQLKLPAKNSSIRVRLEGAQVFEGLVDSVRSQGARGSGRTLSVAAKGFDTRGKAKELQAFHMDDATLSDFLGEAGKSAGFSVKVDPKFAEITRDYWSAEDESFIALGQRLAKELHGTFKIRGNQAVLASRDRDDLPIVEALIADSGGNVIRWDIEPFTGRPAASKARATWFDRKSASYKSREIDIEGLDSDATIYARDLAADEDQAGLSAEARKGEAERESGSGSIELDLAPEAQAEGQCRLRGARSGVDGLYRITSATHRATRSGGATTSLSVKQPSDGAGSDPRQ